MISTLGLHNGPKPSRSLSPAMFLKVGASGRGHHCPYEQTGSVLTNQTWQFFWNTSRLSALKVGKNLKSLLQLFGALSWRKIGPEGPTEAKGKKKLKKDFVLSGTEK